MQDKIVITAVGDIMLGDFPMCNGFGVGSTIKKYGSKFIFEKIKDELSGDIVFGNLESVLSDKNKNIFSINSMSLRGDPKSAEGLKYAGFNILSLANNHSLEHGYEALYDTIDLLNNNDIIPLGICRKKEIARKPAVFNIKNKKIAFLGYCLRPDKTAYRSIKNKEEILEDIEKIKRNVDYIILSLHWGDEFVQIPAPWQIDFAHNLIDNGASIILGHHPHVLQGIEEYNGGIIAYSLGNFVFDMWQRKERESVILKCILSENGEINKELIPVFINESYQSEVLYDNTNNPLSKIDMLSLDLINGYLSNIDEKEYEIEAKLCWAMHHKSYKKYFLKNIHKYQLGSQIQLILNSIKQKLKGLTKGGT
ncbi:MAG TPA: poly-gamma-glutamate biosynthesis protein [Methanophagales archaeon]|nr:poly-gamma-glutamate biosynthesis protein [Methanophagales archaeon]